MRESLHTNPPALRPQAPIILVGSNLAAIHSQCGAAAEHLQRPARAVAWFSHVGAKGMRRRWAQSSSSVGRAPGQLESFCARKSSISAALRPRKPAGAHQQGALVRAARGITLNARACSPKLESSSCDESWGDFTIMRANCTHPLGTSVLKWAGHFATCSTLVGTARARTRF